MWEIVVIVLITVLVTSVWFATADNKDEAGQPWADPEAERKLDRWL